MGLCVEGEKSVCVSRLGFECGVRDGGMGVCVERQVCVVHVFVERLGSVFVCTCGETGVCVRVSV